MSTKAVRPGAMTGVSAGATHRPVLTWVANKREAARLRAARKAAGLTIPQVAARLGKGQQWLQAREKGRTPLTEDEVKQIEKAIRGERGAE